MPSHSTPRRHSSSAAATTSRAERKGQTRRALLDAALERLGGDASFTSLSLREVAKDAGVVPAAFYRHFPDMEALGLTLVEESFSTVRARMRDLRAAPQPTAHVVQASLETFLGYVQEHPNHFRFIAKERYSGSTALRLAIRSEIRLFTSELAIDMARVPRLAAMSAADLQLAAALVVQTVMGATEMVLDARTSDTEEIARIEREASRQLRMVLLGAAVWQSDRAR